MAAFGAAVSVCQGGAVCGLLPPSATARLHLNSPSLPTPRLKAHERMGELVAAGSLLTQMMREADGLPPPDACLYNTVIAAMAHTQPTKVLQG